MHGGRVGKAFALLFAIVGLFHNPFLVFIALFVWLGAAGEAAEAQQRSSLEGVPIERVIIRDVHTLTPRDSLAVALDHVLALPPDRVKKVQEALAIQE